MKKITNHFQLALFLALAILTMSSTSCSQRYNSRLASHRTLLSQIAANKTATAEEKMDVLAGSLVTMMHESLDIINPKKSVRFVQDYANQNEASIDAIFKDLDGWQQNMNPVEKLAFGLKATKKPYAKDLAALLPRFERKFNTIAFVARLTGKLTKGIGSLFFR